MPHTQDAKDRHWTWEFATQRTEWLLERARSLCRSQADAESLTHTVLQWFLQTFESVGRPPSAPICEAWLVTTLTCLFFDQHRRKLREQDARNPTHSGQ